MVEACYSHYSLIFQIHFFEYIDLATSHLTGDASGCLTNTFRPILCQAALILPVPYVDKFIPLNCTPAGFLGKFPKNTCILFIIS